MKNVIASERSERGNPYIVWVRTAVWIAASAFGLLAMTAYAQDDGRAALQDRLVEAAADIRAVEAQVQALEDKLSSLEIKRTNLEQEYEARRAKMAVTLAALSRLGRTPREAVLIRPGGPLQAARTTMLLSASMPAIETQAASYRTLLTELERTRTDMAEKTAQAQGAKADLSARHAQMVIMLNDRSGGQSLEAESAAVANLARAARDLRDLLSGIDHDSALPGSGPVTIPEGVGQLPVSGIVRVRYGAADPRSGGSRSDGLSIETLPGAVVVAPLGGIVRYAGPFKGYGNIVIIAHKGGYHSLIAGLDKLSVSAGQAIVSGEPIAILAPINTANQDSPARRTVYYELRYGGQPVDPSRKLPDLG